jgi:thermitase
MKRAILLVTVMLTAVLVACSGIALAQPNDDTDDTPAPSQPRGQAAPDTVIVKVEEEAPSPRGALEAANRRAGTSTNEQIAPNTLPTLYTVRVPRGLSIGAAIQRLKGSPEIEYAEPNFLQFADLTPNDASYANGTLWGLHNTGQNSGKEDADIDAPTAWDIGTGSSTQPVVAVIDTGVDYNHPDLNGNIYSVRGSAMTSLTTTPTPWTTTTTARTSQVPSAPWGTTALGWWA